MELRIVRRGAAALAIAATLGLAGAQPAAAAEHEWFAQGLRWLSELWSPGPELISIWAQETIEQGYGMDPNGGGGGTQGDPPNPNPPQPPGDV